MTIPKWFDKQEIKKEIIGEGTSRSPECPEKKALLLCDVFRDALIKFIDEVMDLRLSMDRLRQERVYYFRDMQKPNVRRVLKNVKKNNSTS
jgi:hypothetical protein